MQKRLWEGILLGGARILVLRLCLYSTQIFFIYSVFPCGGTEGRLAFRDYGKEISPLSTLTAII